MNSQPTRDEREERLKQIRESRRNFYGGMGQLTQDIDFLLSLLDSQAVDHTRPTGWQDAMQRANPCRVFITFDTRENAEMFLRGLQPAEKLEDAAAVAMRDKCVEKVKALYDIYAKDANETKDYERAGSLGVATHALGEAINEIESLTLDQVGQEKQQS